MIWVQNQVCKKDYETLSTNSINNNEIINECINLKMNIKSQ